MTGLTDGELTYTLDAGFAYNQYRELIKLECMQFNERKGNCSISAVGFRDWLWVTG